MQPGWQILGSESATMRPGGSIKKALKGLGLWV